MRPCKLNVPLTLAFTVSKYSVLTDDATKFATDFLISDGLCFRLRASNSVPKTQTYKSEDRGSVPSSSSGTAEWVLAHQMVGKHPLSCVP
jgi:hypothetical protein